MQIQRLLPAGPLLMPDARWLLMPRDLKCGEVDCATRKDFWFKYTSKHVLLSCKDCTVLMIEQ
jgi:hypothetical protein